MIHILHLANATSPSDFVRDVRFSPTEELVVQAFTDGYYEEVAKVDGIDLDRAYQLTNNIDSSWVDNTGVYPTNPGGKRSTSVGDIFIVDTPSKTRRAFFVAGIGFTEITLPNS